MRLARTRRAAVSFLATAVWEAPIAHGADLCVTCSEPAATYACALEGADPAAPVASGMQVLCIKEMATRGGHGACAISRAPSGALCAGQRVVIARPAGGVLSQDPAAGVPAAGTNAPAAAAPVPPAKAPPATVEALAKEAAEQSKKDWEKTKSAVTETTEAAGQGLKKAGNSVGSAVKKTWDCVVSLFTSC